jgi:hypothetical protein
MSNTTTVVEHEPLAAPAAGPAQPETDALAAAIRKSLDALDAAAEEAAKGMLGAAKLGLLVAASGIIDALKAADAEFARRYPHCRAGRPDDEGDTTRDRTTSLF